MTALVVRGDALRLPLADSTVDLIVTSPPYFALRSYTDGGEHYSGQIGDETSPGQFLDALLAVTAECVRVLRPGGSIWVNLGDKYAERTGPPRRGGVDDDPNISRPADRPARGRRGSVPVKSLMGLPWRYAIRAVDELGLILRSEVVWDKPNCLPESVRDRVRRSHETWFHFTAQPRYYSAIDRLRTPHAAATISRAKYRTDKAMNGRMQGTPGEVRDQANPWQPSTLGAAPGSVWRIPTSSLVVPDSLGVDHFAAFPPEWPRRLILGWSPSGICLVCGQGRQQLAETTQHLYRQAGSTGRPKQQDLGGKHVGGRNGVGYPQTRSETVLAGESCACPDSSAPTRPAVVLDPFVGSGTTIHVASALGRVGIGVDLSHDYCRLAADDGIARQRFAQVHDLAKPTEVPPDQEALW